MKYCQLLIVLLSPLFCVAQSVGIGTTTPDTSAILEMKSNNKGVLIPRISYTARMQIVDPADGLLVYQHNTTVTSMKGFYYFNGSFDAWYRIGASDQIGIGTEVPHPNAILDMRSTSQGVLFPTLTTAQRDAISNPPNGLHIFNSDDKCLNYYDAGNLVWNCYCAECKTVVINIATNQSNLDFYQLVQNNPAPKYLVNINAGVTIAANQAGGDAFIFNTMTFPAAISINNFGIIAGGGGDGGRGEVKSIAGCLGISLETGDAGGDAILTKPGVVINIKNYGIIAGGGGGGNPGANEGENGYGGGGGGGAGVIAGTGGLGGGYKYQSQIVQICNSEFIGFSGQPGTVASGGAGGAGINGGLAGAAGGARGAAASPGGAAGKAIRGGSGNSITNFGNGQYFGIVD